MEQPTQSTSAPMVSVCVPTYNRRQELAITLESLRRQTFQDFELTVCDDASTDGTGAFLAELASEWPKLRVLTNASNLNIYGSLTRLFAEARGKYIGMQHDHDVYEPHFLQWMIEKLESRPDVGFCCSAYHLLRHDGTLVRNPEIAEYELFPPPDHVMKGEELIRLLATRYHTPIAAMTTVFRTETVRRAGGYRPDWRLASDEDLYRRVAALSNVAFVPAPLVQVRERPPGRHAVLGGWKSVLNLGAFRAFTIQQHFHPAPVRLAASARLQLLKSEAIWKQSLSHWYAGEAELVSPENAARAVGPLPEGATVLSRNELIAVHAMAGILGRTMRVGRAMGALKVRARDIRDRLKRAGTRSAVVQP